MLSMSRHLHTVYGSVVPVGSGLCSKCRKSISDEMKSCECCQKVPSNCKMTLNDTAEQFRSLRPRAENYDENCHSETLSQTDESTTCSLSRESNWSTTLEGHIHLTDGIDNLNKALTSLSGGQMSPIKYQLQTPLNEVQASTRRYLKRKATDAVHTILDQMAPGQSRELLGLLLEKNHPEENEQNTKTELEITDSILQLYCEAENNALKRQLLSLLSLPNAHSKSELQKLIPGLTKWEIDQSRLHAASHGAGTLPVSVGPAIRHRMNREKLEHALSFF